MIKWIKHFVGEILDFFRRPMRYRVSQFVDNRNRIRWKVEIWNYILGRWVEPQWFDTEEEAKKYVELSVEIEKHPKSYWISE